VGVELAVELAEADEGLEVDGVDVTGVVDGVDVTGVVEKVESEVGRV
jgi:hypothetical protein